MRLRELEVLEKVAAGGKLSVVLGVKELDEILRGQTTLDRRLAYAFWALAFYTEQHVNSWARESREWPLELANEELIDLLTCVESLFEGGLTEKEPDPSCPRPHDTGEG